MMALLVWAYVLEGAAVGRALCWIVGWIWFFSE